MEILSFVFSSFWIFAGFYICYVVLFKLLFHCWNRFLRHLNVRSKGWPPSHLDADGDFKKDGE